MHGVLSPIEGIVPEDLKIRPLLERVKQDEVKEVIIATNPSMEGDATALYLRQQLIPLGPRITRLARGLPGWRRSGIRRPEYPPSRTCRTAGNGLEKLKHPVKGAFSSFKQKQEVYLKAATSRSSFPVLNK